MSGGATRAALVKWLRTRWKGNEERLTELVPVIRTEGSWGESEAYRTLMNAMVPPPEGWQVLKKDLRGADLREVNLSGANLAEASLDLANLNGANFARANLSKASLMGAKLVRAVFVGTDLSEANLSVADLTEADLRTADLTEAELIGAVLTRAVLIKAVLRFAELCLVTLVEADMSKADLLGADLVGAKMSKANFHEADLSLVVLHQADLDNANLTKANLMKADLSEANLANANLTDASLSCASLVETNLEKANLTGCSIYGISTWNLRLAGTKQSNLVITPPEDPAITVDNLEIGQFIYLLLHSKNIRRVIDTISRKVVLILGRFTPRRKVILDAIREELRNRDYVPILFDFPKPDSRDFTETVSTLAHLARFLIVDITEAKSVPQELQAIVPTLEVPVQPMLRSEARQYGMFRDFMKYPWVLKVHRYGTVKELLISLGEKVIAPAEMKAMELDKN
jgi:uncharacterized protein YjbI with pentapeptide repeats